MKTPTIDSRCYRTGKYTVCRRVRTSFSPENVQAGGSEGVNNYAESLSNKAPLALTLCGGWALMNSHLLLLYMWELPSTKTTQSVQQHLSGCVNIT